MHVRHNFKSLLFIKWVNSLVNGSNSTTILRLSSIIKRIHAERVSLVRDTIFKTEQDSFDVSSNSEIVKRINSKWIYCLFKRLYFIHFEASIKEICKRRSCYFRSSAEYTYEKTIAVFNNLLLEVCTLSNLAWKEERTSFRISISAISHHKVRSSYEPSSEIIIRISSNFIQILLLYRFLTAPICSLDFVS